MLKIQILVVLLLLSTVVHGGIIKKPPAATEKVRYDNFKVFNLKISNKIQLAVVEMFKSLEKSYDIWKEYDSSSKEVHVMVNPTILKYFEKLIKLFGFESELMISNVQDLIDAEVATTRADDGATFGWTRYYELHEIETWLDGILAAYPDVTQEFIIGSSYENRPIRGIKISHKPGNPVIFIESNIHAREWITSATATWFINELLTSTVAAVRDLAENYDWHIIPVFNVDGFAYSHSTDRMWRKTRQPVTTSACIGTDANRNFDSHWMENNGASDNPCSETYAGTAPFSEPEAKALADHLTNIKDEIKIYLSFHSYGQYLLSPYGHVASDFPPNYDDLLEIGNAFSSAINNLQYQTSYAVGSTATVLYVASGSSVDWVYNMLDVKIGYTIEYRDRGRFGFVLPPVQIIPNCEELMAGMLALVGKSKELGYV
ncbi:zinc carboxypeptidase-like [Teleopsis dalmanni]|uniref:zinc carboxypeptidase-like n=1 Tax=Teleopsis dalmanni TaxID=139649 RepID=UPI0018CDF4F8|nr:zinc carboxypeptidase-like [Teleopsis dalmanni]